ncbi:helix-turn-helix domain-containing protein [Nocardia sp. CA-145437]|uniref:helix-turn-helix domain-containing protein n=1 Tax=Nocardia sp. CA-145437 TaxID=3239980 RepID=UPI003D97B7F4
MGHINEELARAVGEALDDAGLSVRQAAEKTGIPRATLQRKLRGAGKAGFEFSELYSLAAAINRPMRDLLPGEWLV